MNRREFSQLSLMGLASTFFTSSCALRVPPKTAYPSSGNGSLYLMFGAGPKQSLLRKIDLDSFETAEAIVPIANPHSTTARGTESGEIIVFDFRGSAVKINPASGEHVLVDQAGTNNMFLGHGVYTPDSDFVWCSERVNGVAKFQARSAKDLSLIKGDKYSLLGGHHLVKLPGSGLIVTYGFHHNRHNIYFYDPVKLAMVNEIEVKYPAVHILALSETEVVMGTTETLMDDSDLPKFQTTSMTSMKQNKGLDFIGHSPVVSVNVNGTVKEYWDPSRKKLFRMGFGLDRIHGSNDSFLTSHFLSDTVILWKGGEIQKTFDITGPLVVVALNDGKRFVVQSEHRMKVFSLETGEMLKEVKYNSSLIALSKY